MENVLLLERLWKARASEKAEKIASKNKSKDKSRNEETVVIENPETSVKLSTVSKEQQISKNRRRKNALKAKKQVRILDNSGRTNTEITFNAATDKGEKGQEKFDAKHRIWTEWSRYN